MVTRQDYIDAQAGVLGSVLISPELAGRVISETSERDYEGPYKALYRAILKLYMDGKPADVLLVDSILGPEYKQFLAEIMDITPTAARIGHYIEACKRHGRYLRIRDLAEQMRMAETLDELMPIVDEVNEAAVDKAGCGGVSMLEALQDFYERHTGDKHYLTWPIPELNDRLYVDKGDFVIIGGYSSSGKTAFALQCAWHMAETHNVGFFSLETGTGKLFDRQIAATSKIGMDKIKRNQLTPTDWERLTQLSSDITEGHRLTLHHASGITVADIRSLSLMQHFDVIFVDYLQLIESKRTSRYEVVTEISMALHTMAQTTGITIVALAQLSRAEKKDGKQIAPSMSSLRESGQIEQDADVIFLLYPEDANDKLSPRVLKIDKNKEGECGRMLLSFDGKTQTFARLDRDALTPAVQQAAKYGTGPRRQANPKTVRDDLSDLPPGWVQQEISERS